MAEASRQSREDAPTPLQPSPPFGPPRLLGGTAFEPQTLLLSLLSPSPCLCNCIRSPLSLPYAKAGPARKRCRRLNRLLQHPSVSISLSVCACFALSRAFVSLPVSLLSVRALAALCSSRDAYVCAFSSSVCTPGHLYVCVCICLRV